MKKTMIAVFAACLAPFAQAETMQVSSTTHWVTVDPGQPVQMPSGAKGMRTMRLHGSVVGSDGMHASQWCTGHSGVSADGAPGGAGYCTMITDDGDMLYISYMTDGATGKSMWSVMGGTGAYAGATGSGTTSLVSRRGDGLAWTSTAEGSITTP